MLQFVSCSSNELELSSEKEVELVDFPFAVSNENGILNFETKTDYEMTLDYLVELETKGELDQFETALGFDSYRTTFKYDREKMDAIQDDILATFLNPSNKVIMEQKMFEDNIPEDRVTVWAHENCELKSSTKENLIGEFSCSDDVFDKLEGKSILKSATELTYCKHKPVSDSSEGTVDGYLYKYDYNIKYIKAGLYYTLNTRISVDYTKTTIGLETSTCNYTKKDGTYKEKSQTESGYNWERNYRPFWGLSRLKDYNFKVKFTASFNGTSTLSTTLTNNCNKSE